MRLAWTFAAIALGSLMACGEDFSASAGSGSSSSSSSSGTGGGSTSTSTSSSASSSSSTGGQSQGGGGQGQGGEGGEPLPCDDGFSFIPVQPTAGDLFEVTYVDDTGWIHTGLDVSPESTYVMGTQADPPPPVAIWKWDVIVGEPGVHTFEFTRKDTKKGPTFVQATCQHDVLP